MLDWRELQNLPDEELGRYDIAEINLSCAQGLPGTEGIDFEKCLWTIGHCAEQVRWHTGRIRRQFEQRPSDFDNSWALFRVMDMVTVLQRDLGITYRQDLLALSDAEFFSRPEHLFVHGVTLGPGGTCSSLPIFYVAVGRRLSYPLKLVHTAQHRFARWEGEGERFNVECTSRGLNCHSDEYYKSWPHPVPDEEIQRYGMLRSLTPRQELSSFLLDRGLCWEKNGCWREAVSGYACAHELNADCWLPAKCLVEAMNAWDRHLNTLLVPGFPSMAIAFPPRQYPSLPADLEQGIYHMIVKENLLTDPVLEQQWWGPLRRDPQSRPPTLPAYIEVEYPQDRVAPPRIRFLRSAPPGFYSMPLQPA